MLGSSEGSAGARGSKMASCTCLAVSADYWLEHFDSHLSSHFPEDQTRLL